MRFRNRWSCGGLVIGWGYSERPCEALQQGRPTRAPCGASSACAMGLVTAAEAEERHVDATNSAAPARARERLSRCADHIRTQA